MTDSLAKILKMPTVKRLESREQLGLVIVTTYLRSPQFAQYLLTACSGPRISLLEWGRATKGLHAHEGHFQAGQEDAP